MSIQIFVEGKIAPKGEFLRPMEGRTDAEILGRHLYLSLAGEVIPRALLDHLGLSRMLLGASSGSGFLLLLPLEARTQSEAFLKIVSSNLAELSAGELELDWAITENLGDWTIVRKRLFEEMQRGMGTKATPLSFVPIAASSIAADKDFFTRLAESAPSAVAIAVDPAAPGRFTFSDTSATYKLGYEPDSLPWLAHLDLSVCAVNAVPR